MARRFFEPESLVWKPFGYLGELVMMSLLWGLCAIPLVTIGPASAALYDCAVHCLRRKEGDLFSRFFAPVKDVVYFTSRHGFNKSCPVKFLYSA